MMKFTFCWNGNLNLLRDTIGIRINTCGGDHRAVLFASKRFLIAFSPVLKEAR